MRVSIVQSGGLAPVVTTTVADSAALSPEDADELRAKVEEAGVFDLSSSAALDVHPEQSSCEIEVEHEGQSHRVTLRDSDVTDPIRSLLSWVGTLPGREERIGRLGEG